MTHPSKFKIYGVRAPRNFLKFLLLTGRIEEIVHTATTAVRLKQIATGSIFDVVSKKWMRNCVLEVISEN